MINTKENQISACHVWNGISWSRKDSLPTVEQIKLNNVHRDTFCEGA